MEKQEGIQDSESKGGKRLMLSEHKNAQDALLDVYYLPYSCDLHNSENLGLKFYTDSYTKGLNNCE